jgi:pimeloyl-ACP methyl ester carboxylesterase
VIDFLARRAFLGAGLRSLTLTLPSSGSTTNTIHYWPPPGEPRLPSLLLVHGFGPMATWQWRRQVGPLSRHFHVIAPDLLCFGASSCDCNPAPSEAAALAALLDAVAAGARVAVAGTSYGGFVAYALARAAGPRRVCPVVVSNSDLLKTAADLLVPLDARGGSWSSPSTGGRPSPCCRTSSSEAPCG